MWRRALFAIICLIGAFIMAASPAGAQDDTEVPFEFGFVDVIEANGLLDDVLADFISRSLDESVELGARAVILQMESGGSTLADADFAQFIETIESYPLPLSVWLGPANNGDALGRAGLVAVAADRIGISPGSELELPSGDVIGYDELLATADSFDFEVQDAPALLNHLLELDEFDFAIYEPGETLPGGAEVLDAPVRVPQTATRFITLPLIEQQFHTFASPAIAYLLFVIGLALLVFELFTAGIGIAGVIGAGSLLAGGYGLGVLDARPWAVALLIIAFIGFAIDVQSGIQQFWSGVGVVFLILGSLFLLPDHSIGWLPLLVGIVGMCLAMLSGMPAMVRTRFLDAHDRP